MSDKNNLVIAWATAGLFLLTAVGLYLSQRSQHDLTYRLEKPVAVGQFQAFSLEVWNDGDVVETSIEISIQRGPAFFTNLTFIDNGPNGQEVETDKEQRETSIPSLISSADEFEWILDDKNIILKVKEMLPGDRVNFSIFAPVGMRVSGFDGEATGISVRSKLNRAVQYRSWWDRTAVLRLFLMIFVFAAVGFAAFWNLFGSYFMQLYASPQNRKSS